MKTGRILLLSGICLSLVAVFLLPAWSAQEVTSGGFLVPDIPHGEETSYRVTFSDRKEYPFAWDAELAWLQGFSYRITKFEEDGGQFISVEEIERLDRGMSNKYVTLFEAGSYMRMLNYSKNIYSFSGKIIRKEFSDFDDPAFDFPEYTVLVHVLTFWLRGIDFKVGKVYAFNLLMGDTSNPWRMFVRVGPVEQVEVPAGKFECYKVTMEADLKSILGKWNWVAVAIQGLIPEFYMWYGTDKAHPMVKFVGALGPKGITPTETHELISYSVP